jgi:DNA-directed RNA polymerase subunit RPC12/RpoP
MSTQERGADGFAAGAGFSGADAGGQSYPCEACGATVEFAPGADALKCPYCGHEQAVAAVPRQVREHPIEELAALPAKPRATALGAARAFVCPGCGARTETDDLSARCQFCATALVADPELTERIVPEAVVPFGLDRRAAREKLGEWTSSRWFAPGSLKKVTEAETFKGSYLPHWTYDAATTSHYEGQRGEYYYTTETYTATENGEQVTRTRQVRHTRWHHVSGTVARGFDDILVAGTGHVAAAQLDKLTPWPLEEARPYQAEYLAGFQTVRYDVEPEQGLETAKQRMAEVIEGDCRADIGGDEQRVTSVDTRYDDVTYKLVLLPVWFLTYLHAGRSWQVMVNARTGEVIGERPYSAAKITAAVVLALAVIAAVVAAVALR